jgi:O-acetyl-ADP-ribose deacetylase (regulator of RNase III)
VSSVRFVRGDATRPLGEGMLRVVAHVCNDVGAWGCGFVLAVARRWPAAERGYRAWFDEAARRGAPTLELGRVQHCLVDGPCYHRDEAWDFGDEDDPDVPPPGDSRCLWVANMVAQRGIRRRASDPPAVCYDALATCLDEVFWHAVAHGASVHLPRIGAGLAGGDWARIERLVRATLVDRADGRPGVDVVVYALT